jgi:NADH-quinone oxidoreductase subunit N
MPANMFPDLADIIRYLPEIILSVAGSIIMMLSASIKDRHSPIFGSVALLSLGAAIAASFPALQIGGLAFHGMVIADGFATFFRVLVMVVGILTVLSSFAYLRRERVDSAEYYALVLFCVAGQGVMVSANQLIMIFLGLEISSIATYVLAAYLRDDQRATEAAIKYFLLGSFATAFLLYGIALIYGGTGSTNLLEIRQILTTGDSQASVLLVGTAAALMFVGFAFKVSAAPFQIWTPDVYQGAPAPVSAFLSAGPKAAAFAVFLRVYLTAFEPIAASWQPLVWTSALLTMVVGNFAALAQHNVKRLLAYSSIAHAGYVMVALTAQSNTGAAAAMFYLAAYAFMNVGAFAVVVHFSRQGERYVNVQDFAGLGSRQPGTAALFSIFLLSLIGVPLTGGFFGKFYIFKAALDSNLIWLTVLGLLNSAVAAYYYLRILVVMYMHEPGEAADTVPPLSAGIRTALWTSAAATLVLGVFPSAVLDFAGWSADLIK